MEEFYNKMDESWFSDYFRGPDSAFHNVSEAFYRQTYGAHYPEMEKLILKAAAQPMTEIQKQRFTQVIANNMRVLQWRLRTAGYLPENYSSAYTIDAKQTFELLSTDVTQKNRYITGVVPAKVELGAPKQETTTAVPNHHYTLIYPTKDGEVRLKATNVHPGGSFLFYYVVDEKSKDIASGVLEDNAEITFTAKANTPYYFAVAASGVTNRRDAKWEVSIAGATPAQASFAEGVVSLSATAKDNVRDLYAYVPEKLGLIAVSTASGTTIQALESDVKKSNYEMAVARSAQRATAAASKQYQGSLIKDLREIWKFTTDPEKKGVEQGFFKKDFVDKSWKPMTTIGSWQAQGFEKYHGTAWYRKTFALAASDQDPALLNGKDILLFVGAVDGDAVFYLNGKKVAERKQEDYLNSWELPFAVDVSSALDVGENTLAVEVTKDRSATGLVLAVSLISGTLEAKK